MKNLIEVPLLNFDQLSNFSECSEHIRALETFIHGAVNFTRNELIAFRNRVDTFIRRCRERRILSNATLNSIGQAINEVNTNITQNKYIRLLTQLRSIKPKIYLVYFRK